MCLGNLMPQVVPHIIYLCYTHQDRGDFQQLLIFHVINESTNGDCIFWLEDVRVWGIVNNDGGRQVSA